MSLPDLILASTSRYRRDLLSRLGIPFRTLAPHCDEESYKGMGLQPRALAEALARAKARSLAGSEPRATVIGSDQVAVLEGAVLGKPGSSERAIDMLLRLSGKRHELITAVCILHQGQEHHHTDITTLEMRALGRRQIERYVAADLPSDCAGAYKLEARGIGLFSAISSQDHSAITGLPLLAVARILASLGFEFP